MSITVLIPARGKAPYIEQSLQSIFNSKFKPEEIILIDDGLELETINLIKKYKNLYNIVLIKNSGRGIVDALNLGISNSKGKYIARLDSDDLMHKDRLEKQFQILENDTSIAVVGSQVEYIDSENNTIGKSNYPIGVLNALNNFASQCLIAHPSTTIRKSTLLKVGGYRNIVKIGNTSLCEDFDLWRRISAFGQLVNLEKAFTAYRQHDLQVSNLNYLPNMVATQIVASGFSDFYGKVVYIDPISKRIKQDELRKILAFQNMPNKIVFKLKYSLMREKNNTNFFSRFIIFIEKGFLIILNRILSR